MVLVIPDGITHYFVVLTNEKARRLFHSSDFSWWSRGESNPGPTGTPAFFSVRSLPELFLSLNLLGKLEIL